MAMRGTIAILKGLSRDDLAVLRALEIRMDRYEYVPADRVARLTKLDGDAAAYSLRRVHRLGLVRRQPGPYLGWAINSRGYDCLALDDLVRRGLVEALGKPLGIGKEADVYEGLSPGGERIAVKFHRIGRVSFRQTRRKRGYLAKRPEASWLAQSRLAAEREYSAMRLAYPVGVSVPKPIGQSRHVIVMGLIEGAPLAEYSSIPGAHAVLQEILSNTRRAYLDAGIVHADLSEFNVLIKPDSHILIIDWPQYVSRDHPNAELLLRRDLRNVGNYFKRKFGVSFNLGDALRFVGVRRASPPRLESRS